MATLVLPRTGVTTCWESSLRLIKRETLPTTKRELRRFGIERADQLKQPPPAGS